MPPEERPKAGQQVNLAKREVSDLIYDKKDRLQQRELEQELKSQTIDVSLPGRARAKRSLHPVTQVKNKINAFFHTLGFEIA